ncbi:MAG: FKBP-type peptidyl-prolyl cis-trans isomerase [Bacteroidota bacterium]|jgi:FKBP-type peptidyl-prolyl cis-trans isomerase|nr:FKBP-type peptidyl-prolyl cis-trans isomerase [Bacteroidota bacterium]
MNKTSMLLGSALLAGLFACNKSEFDGFTKAENGLHYKFFTPDENGVKATEGDGVSIKIVYALKKNPSDSVLFDSKLNSEDGSGTVRYILPKSSFKGSLEDAIAMMAKNDSAAFIISADSFFLKTNRMQALPEFAKPGDKLVISIKMVDIKSKKELEENQKKQEAEMNQLSEQEKPKLDAYLAEHKITAKPTESGLYVIETKKGTGAKPQAGDEVSVNYTGRLLDGTIFDTSIEADAKAGNVYNPQRPYEPIKFALDQGQVIKGWDEALKLLSKGGKAQLIIPSNLAYGPRGGGPIPPFSTLVFDVELVDFKSAGK